MSKRVEFLCDFARSKKVDVDKSSIFKNVFWVESKSVVLLCVFGFCVFLLGRKGEMSKSVVFVERVVFLCVFWVKPPAGPLELSAQPTI